MSTPLFVGKPPELLADRKFNYSREQWMSRLPNVDQWPARLDRKPSNDKWPFLDRQGVFALADVQSPEDAVHLYVAACVWGTGLKARGVSRRVIVLRDNPEAGKHLFAAINTMRQDGPVSAYRALYRGGSDRLIGLGPAFFTKVLYFAGWDRAAGDQQPLILDQFVVVALNDQADLGWKLNWAWSGDQYAKYLDLAHEWACGWGKDTAPDVVERALFQRGKELSSGPCLKWSDGWLS